MFYSFFYCIRLSIVFLCRFVTEIFLLPLFDAILRKIVKNFRMALLEKCSADLNSFSLRECQKAFENCPKRIIWEHL